jgi:methionyl-tRNA formyltransferase
MPNSSPLTAYPSPKKAVVFAYHNVGVRCLSVLLAHGVEVALVLTHEDSPTENIWFDSVAKLAAAHDIPVITPEDANAPEVVARIKALAPDFIFSFYYRQMMKPELLSTASRGAYNMHGSLLPKYRGRVPVNWAIIHGEKETGATLHEMVVKPDAGAIVARQAVPILPNDTASDVFTKVTVAAEMALNDVLPALLAGNAPSLENDLASGSYFGGRKAEDGRIDWTKSAADIHNLVRAVAPPYPGAFTTAEGRPFKVLRTLPVATRPARHGKPMLYREDGRLWAECGDGGVLRILEAEGDWLDAWDGAPCQLGT